MKEQALDVPKEMNGCIDLSEDELKELKRLLDKAVSGMGKQPDETYKLSEKK